MERELKFTLLICVALAAVGCGGEGGAPALDPLDATPRYAVVSSDFSSSSIAMLNEDFVVIEESWLNSGTTYPGLVATLSGDVVLPNRQAGDGTFAVIDRFLTDVVTRFFVPSGISTGRFAPTVMWAIRVSRQIRRTSYLPAKTALGLRATSRTSIPRRLQRTKAMI